MVNRFDDPDMQESSLNFAMIDICRFEHLNVKIYLHLNFQIYMYTSICKNIHVKYVQIDMYASICIHITNK